MTAVESHPASNPFMDSQVESPTSRFTAVNGREPSNGPSTGANNSNTHSRRESEERPSSRVSPPGQEKLTVNTSAERQDWASTVNGEKPSSGTPGQAFTPPANYPEPENSHKRKRSGSMDREISQPTNTNSYHNHGMPTSKPSVEGPGRKSPDTPYPDVIRESNFPPYGNEHREANAPHWYSHQHERPLPPEAQPPPPTHPMTPEDQLRDALQKENQNSATTPQGEEDRNAAYSGGYVQVSNPAIAMQGDQKKRKRNFSNRTKTGCMTCRRRKKKCDETRPECNNCIRGGFVCNGYPSRGTWPKTEQKQTPVPLQSKDGFDAGSNTYPQGAPYQHPPPPPPPPPPGPPGPPKREPLPGYRGQTLRVEPPQTTGRPIGLDDDRSSASTIPSASVGSPENRLSAVSYAQAGPFPTPVSANPPSGYPDRLSQNDYKRMPPLLDPSRQEHDPTGVPPPQTGMPHINILHPPHAGSPHTPQSAALQDAARLTLSHPASASRPRTQKEEMLAGKHYFPFDRELVLERERCLAACWRFNNSTNPNNGFSPENRLSLFRDILQPKDLINLSPTIATPISPAGYIGAGVVVEAPFNCDYGYNISIGQDVLIGKNCTILDTCEVKIGDRCVIGPNVNIFTATLPIDPKKRLGSRGPQLGKPIVIEEDCWIGGGVTILPGRTIKRGSTVGAGSVVTRDVPPFTVVGGNPAHVMRGIHE